MRSTHEVPQSTADAQDQPEKSHRKSSQLARLRLADFFSTGDFLPHEIVGSTGEAIKKLLAEQEEMLKRAIKENIDKQHGENVKSCAKACPASRRQQSRRTAAFQAPRSSCASRNGTQCGSPQSGDKPAASHERKKKWSARVGRARGRSSLTAIVKEGPLVEECEAEVPQPSARSKAESPRLQAGSRGSNGTNDPDPGRSTTISEAGSAGRQRANSSDTTDHSHKSGKEKSVSIESPGAGGRKGSSDFLHQMKAAYRRVSGDI